MLIAQRLVRSLGPKCKKKIKPKKETRSLILKEIKNLPEKIKKPLYIWEAKGCKDCRNEGFSGRVALFEILEMTPQLSNLILK